MMVKKFSMLVATAILALMFSGCSAKPQVITLKDGEKIIIHDKGSYNEDTGFYEYTNKNGTKSRINKNDIVSIDDI